MSVSLPRHVAALGLVAADILFRAIRTRCLLPLPFSRVLTINTCGDALAAVTPGRIGGDPVRYLGFRRQGAPGPAILALFGIEIASDAIVLCGVAVLLAVLFRSAGQEFLVATRHLLRTRGFWLLIVAMVALTVGSIVLTRRWLPRALETVAVSLREAWRCVRAQTPGILGGTIALALLSLIARGAILPVLLIGTPGLDLGTVVLGSAVLVYGQVLAPTPAGVGAVEIGAVVSLGGKLPLEHLPALLLLWRTYTLVLGVLAGTALLVREAWPGRLTGSLAAAGEATRPS